MVSFGFFSKTFPLSSILLLFTNPHLLFFIYIIAISFTNINTFFQQRFQNNQIMSKTLKRINNEFKDIQQNPPPNWRVIKTSNLQWTVWMEADESTPFYGIPIKVYVSFPQNYPESPPTIKFAQPQLFFHANISPSGKICHKIVMSNENIGIRQRIQGLRNLLATPNYDSCLNSTAGKMLQTDQKNNTRLWFKKALKIFRGCEKQ